jgi:hypothetical protein
VPPVVLEKLKVLLTGFADETTSGFQCLAESA